MADNETPVQAALRMDRDEALGNSKDPTGRRALHTVNFDGNVPQPTKPYDAVNAVQVDPATIAFLFYNGGKTGELVQTITIEYPSAQDVPFTWVVFS